MPVISDLANVCRISPAHIFDSTTYMLYTVNMGMTARQVMRILKKNGWKLDRTEGSHHIFRKAGFARSVPVPFHKGKDADLGFFAKEILKEAGIDPVTLREVRK